MASATLGSSYSITSGESLSYATTGHYLSHYKVGGVKQQYEEYAANGVDGYGTKRHGAREASLTLSVYGVDSNENACVSGLADMIDDLGTSGVITITVAGRAKKGYILGDQSAIDQVKSTGRGTFRAEAALVFRLIRSA